MKSHFHASLLGLSMLALTPFAAAAPSMALARTNVLSTSESVELRALASPELGSMRAGRVEAPHAMAADERAALQRASEDQVGLQDLRAGELTEHEWTLIAVGALVVLILIIVL